MSKSYHRELTQGPAAVSRRDMLKQLAGGLGVFAAADLMAAHEAHAAGAAVPVAASKLPHFPAKAKHIIYLYMSGGPSHVDMFDPKPSLKKYAGQRPGSVQVRTERVTGGLLPSPWEFNRCGQSGLEITSILPKMQAHADDLCVIRSMFAENPTHTPGGNFMHSGNIASTRPTLGAWLSYGLGTENQNLPGYVALCAGVPNAGGAALWRSGFLPPEYQGTHFNQSQVDPKQMIRYLRNEQLKPDMQRHQLDLMQELNQDHLAERGSDPLLEARIQSMETAFRMQTAASEAFDVRLEAPGVREEYGKSDFANGCLLARRLVERGVRYIQVYYPGQPWDHHGRIAQDLPKLCNEIDQPIAALLKDLKQRGLLDETLVVWGGEFGRTPVSEGGDGRDHNPYGFTMWMAGGGVKGGTAYGETDEFGFRAEKDKVSVHDLHATILYLMGLNHEKLTYRYSGRDFRLTDVSGRVVKEILV